VSMESATIDTVRLLAAKYTNWGRWGDDDQLGTLNYLQPADRVAAAALITSGEVLSLSIPFDEKGPQNALSGRPNPLHLMSVTGRDFAGPESAERDQRRGYLQNADDVLVLATQAATQWDGLAHVFFEQQMYNGYSVNNVSSGGARRNAITNAVDKMAGRGVLLDIPAARDMRYLPPGWAVTAEDLDRACEHHGVQVRRGDFVLVRTGAIGRVRERGEWGDYAGGDAPGMGLESVAWVAEHQIAGIATDTWDVEVRPAQTIDVAQPVHILFIVMLGLWIGEIFDLEALSSACQQRGRYEFFFTAPPLRITRGIGSPINPQVIL
jgi:kynurenine formamidase